MPFKQTPSQTIGPFFAYGLTPKQYGYSEIQDIASNKLDTDEALGEKINIEGNVFDGNNEAIDDALIEIWQASSSGHYFGPENMNNSNDNFCGFGRCGTGTDTNRKFSFTTIKPGVIEENQAPHINFIIFMRGLLSHVYTRMYFPEETQTNEHDCLLLNVPEDRRQTLIAKQISSGEDKVYRFNIYMQGPHETVFFDF